MEKIAIMLISDAKGEYEKALKDYFKNSKNFEPIWVNENNSVYDSTIKISQILLNKEASRAVLIDDFGSLPFMVAAKHHGIVIAQINDSHSAFMTMGHNNATGIALGTSICGVENLIAIVDRYLNATFDGGRHMVRIDMLNKIC